MRNTEVPITAALSFAALVCTGSANGDVLWTTNPDMPTTFISSWVVGPSAQTWIYNHEAADDFNVIGSIEKVLADGQDCVGCYAGQPVAGVFVRFYEWTPDGPGALQEEYFLEDDDPNFEWTPGSGPAFLQITLPVPFQATGWHFVSVQVAFEGEAYQWNFHRTNIGSPMGAPAYYRDLDAGGEWDAYHATAGWPPLDVSFQLEGVPGGEALPEILVIGNNPTCPSGRIRIDGSAFGDDQANGQVLIDDVPAFVTQWTDQTIIAYVPERIGPGPAQLELIIDEDVVDSYELIIEPRQVDLPMKWRFAVDADYMNHRPGIGPDGSIYINDVKGRLYALSPDGGLQWVVDALRGQVGLGAEGPVVVGDDGTIYVAVNPVGPTTDIVAYHPDGSLYWEFVEPDSWGVAVGPAVGPDGNVYVAFYDIDQDSFGITSFTPEGQLRWNNNGSPPLYEHGAIGAELVFGASEVGGPIDQVVLTVDRDLDPWLYAFAMNNGEQNWAIPRGVVESGFLQYQIQPATGPQGHIYMTEFTGLSGLGWGLKKFNPENSDELWRFDNDIAADASGPDVGADGTIYFSWDISRVTAVSPDAEELWTHVDWGGIRTGPIVSPNNEVVMVGGGEFGQSGFFKAIDADNGDELWKYNLPIENFGNVSTDARAIFTPDSATAYFPTLILADPEPFQYSYLYALQVANIAVPGDVDGDGVVGVQDLLALLAAWGACDFCAEDLDGNGTVEILDLLALLSLWS